MTVVRLVVKPMGVGMQQKARILRPRHGGRQRIWRPIALVAPKVRPAQSGPSQAIRAKHDTQGPYGGGPSAEAERAGGDEAGRNDGHVDDALPALLARPADGER